MDQTHGLRIKICGITNAEDAAAAAAAGADAIGLNFVGGPRQVATGPAAEILESLPPFVTPVALVRLTAGQFPDEILELLGQFWVSHLQLYGDLTSESLEVLARDGFRVIPVLAVQGEAFAGSPLPWQGGLGQVRPHAVLLDTHDPGKAGGTGRTFPWSWLQGARERGELADWPPIMLAGGLDPENVAEAVRTVRPFGIDVSSGVEIQGSPGRKDPARMRLLVEWARAAVAGA